MDLFDTAPCLTREIIEDYRNAFNDLSTAYHIEKRYLNKHRDKKFLFNDELSLCFTGLSLQEAHWIHENYLAEHESYFRIHSSLEMFNALMERFPKFS